MSIFIEDIQPGDDYLKIKVRVHTACCKKIMYALWKEGVNPFDPETYQEFNGFTKQLILDAVNAYNTTRAKK